MTDKEINDDYYVSAKLSLLYKRGEIGYNNNDHSDPEYYGLTREEALKIKIRYLRNIKKDLEKEIADLKTEYMLKKRPYAYLTINVLEEKLDKAKKDIYFYSKSIKDKNNKLFDIEQLRKIPLDKVTEILPNCFFVHNPFRQENSPSNSLAWDKKVNKWTDFGSGERGDVFDLVMAIKKCNFYEACKALSVFT